MSTRAVDIEQLAEHIGYTPRTLVRRLTTGSFKMRELAKIAELLECSVPDLVKPKRRQR